jgi:hypothetical protein
MTKSKTSSFLRRKPTVGKRDIPVKEEVEKASNILSTNELTKWYVKLFTRNNHLTGDK